jgi:hypothetical protein
MSAETLTALADRCGTEGPSYTLDAEISAELDLWQVVDGVVHPRNWTYSAATAETALLPGRYAMSVPTPGGPLYAWDVRIRNGEEEITLASGESNRSPALALLAALLRDRAAALE